MLKDILLSIMMMIAALCQILITKDLWLLSLIMIATLWQIWWLAVLLSGVGLLLRSWWIIFNPQEVWFEAVVGCQYQPSKLERTNEWERSQVFRAFGLATLGMMCLMFGLALFINLRN